MLSKHCWRVDNNLEQLVLLLIQSDADAEVHEQTKMDKYLLACAPDFERLYTDLLLTV